MKRSNVAVLILLAVASSTGCNERQAGASDKATSQQPSSPPSHLTFRGLRAGQSQEEVWAILKAGPDKQLQEIANDPGTHCKPDKRGVYCSIPSGQSLIFSREDKLVQFQLSIIMSYRGMSSVSNPDEFLPALRRELAAANHEEGKESHERTIIGDKQTFTWGTDRTVVCPDNQGKDDCPSEEIELTEYNDGKHCCMAHIHFEDNGYLSEGMTKKDENRPQPRVSLPMTFMGLESGEPRSQVDAALQRMHYRPLACKHIEEAGESCTTRSQNYQFELSFIRGRLSMFNFRYPASEHDELYQMLVKSLGQPTDFQGKKGAETFVWKSERSVCVVGCTAAETLGLSPPENGEPNGTVFLSSL